MKKAEEETMANFQKMLKEIARRNGTTPEHVRQEMQRAIDRGRNETGRPRRCGRG